MKHAMRRTASACALIFTICAAAIPAAGEESEALTVPFRLESVLGREVSTMSDGDGGRIIDVLVDRSGSVRGAVVEFGGFLGIGTRKIAVAWDAFRFYGRSILVDVSREQLRAAPEYKPSEPPVLVRAAITD